MSEKNKKAGSRKTGRRTRVSEKNSVKNKDLVRRPLSDLINEKIAEQQNREAV